MKLKAELGERAKKTLFLKDIFSAIVQNPS